MTQTWMVLAFEVGGVWLGLVLGARAGRWCWLHSHKPAPLS